MSEGTDVAAGWYADPFAQAALRWWDGVTWTGHVAEAPQPVRAAPPPRLIRTADDAELVAAEWMVYWGFTDASRTRASRDGGIDVDSRRAVAQVKATHAPVGRPVLQALHGAATALGKQSLFFALENYTPDARAWAEDLGMALFRFDLQGTPEPVNAAARHIVQQLQPTFDALTAAEGVPPSLAVPVERLLTRALTTQQAMTVAARKVGRREQVVRGYDVWLPLELVRLDYATRHRFGRTRAHADLLIHESLSGSRWTPREKEWTHVAGTSDAQVLPPRVRAADLATESNLLWQKLRQLKQAAALERTRAELVKRGVPTDAVFGAFHDGGEVLLPLHLAIVNGSKGVRIVAIDVHAGTANDQLSQAATEQAGWLRTTLA